MQAVVVCRICRCTERNASLSSPFLKSLCLGNKETLQGSSYEQSEDADDLLTPCRCRGTMKWVHRGCLEEWRRTSAPGSDSFLKCDMCKTEYRFHCKKWQRVLGSKPAVFLYSLFVCLFLIIGAVLVSTECRSSLDDILPVFEMVEAKPDSETSTSSSPMMMLFDTIFKRHMIIPRMNEQSVKMLKNVFSGLAALSLLQLLIVDGSVGLSFNLMFSLWRLVHYDFTLDYFLSTMFIILGIWRMAHEVHRLTKMMTARLLTLKLANFHDKRE